MRWDAGRGAAAAILAVTLALGLSVGPHGDGTAAEASERVDDVAAAATGEPVTDACPTEAGRGRFGDVDAGGAHARAIDCAAWWGIAKGVGEGRYGPRGDVTRAQTASFVARLVRASGGPLPASPVDAFTDDDGSVHHYATNRLAAVGLVRGRGDGLYRPQAAVTRGQMASFLVRSFEQRTGRRLAATRDHFSDDDGSVHEPAINKAAEAGLALGVAADRFAPNAAVTRAQMASFLVRGLALLVDGGHVADSPGTLRRASALRAFDACEDLLAYYKEEALELVGPYGFGGGFVGLPVLEGPADDAPEPAPAERGVGFSGTNVQEEGVDESDVVKTDGRRLLTVAGGRLHRTDVTGGTPVPAGSLAVGGHGGELLLAADRALVLSSTAGRRSDGSHHQTALLQLVDVGEGADMRVAATLQIDGSPLSARLVDGVARVVVRSSPDLPFAFPDHRRVDGEAVAARHNRKVVENSTIADWLPGYTRRGQGAQATAAGPLVACDGVARPPEFSGLDLLSVVTVDLAGDFTPDASTSVLADGRTVYASQTGLYVATARGDFVRGDAPDGTDVTTEIHAFDISEPRAAVYTASGKVGGFVLDQFSLSEHAGVLRVATTSEPPGGGEDAESQVVVLRRRGSTLEEVGRVGGLGRGERIQAVRFIGDLGYVVTYRQVDPLYTVDLSNPTIPTVRGELKILGYSAYLHPVGERLLLGVGVDADDAGARLGTQVSLFDVSDPAHPRRLHQAVVADAFSEVEFDHRAFLWWAPLGRAVLPLHVFSDDERTGATDGFIGVVGFDVDAGAGIREAGRVTHAEGRDGADFWSTPSIRRSVVIGDVLYTVSERGVKASDLTTMADRGWTPFG